MILYSSVLEDNLNSNINKYKLLFGDPYCRFGREGKIEVGHKRKVRPRRYMEVCTALSLRFDYLSHHKSSGSATESSEEQLRCKRDLAWSYLKIERTKGEYSRFVHQNPFLD